MEFHDRRNARLYDLTQPLIINKTPICQAVAELWPAPRTGRYRRPGCGTGLFSLPVLAVLDSFDYLGLDASGAMIQVLREKLERQPARGATLFYLAATYAGRDAYEAVWQFQPDVVISAQFLQYIPIQPASGQIGNPLSDWVSTLLQQTTGRRAMVLFEDVAVETQQETCELGAAWDCARHPAIPRAPGVAEESGRARCRFRPRCEASDGQSSDHGAGPARAAAVLEARTSSRCRPTRTCSNKLDSPRPSRSIRNWPTSISSSSSPFILQPAISRRRQPHLLAVTFPGLTGTTTSADIEVVMHGIT